MMTTATALVPTAGLGDAGRVSDEPQQRPNPEVPERARRRTFTAQYKLDILAEYDAAEDGAKGALLRRDPQAERIAQLEAERLRLEQELAKARFVVDVQAKLHALLETISESTEPDSGSSK